MGNNVLNVEISPNLKIYSFIFIRIYSIWQFAVIKVIATHMAIRSWYETKLDFRIGHGKLILSDYDMDLGHLSCPPSPDLYVIVYELTGVYLIE